MKALYILPPLLALVAVVAWNVVRWRADDSLKTENVNLRGRIVSVARDRTPDGREVPSGGDSPGFSEIVEMRSRGVSLSRKEFKQRMAGMPAGEILKAADELSALGLSGKKTEGFEEVLIELLVEKDPELAIQTFSDRIVDDVDGIGWRLSQAFGDWVEKDTEAATAWFDAKVADGMFKTKSLDDRSEARQQFEAELLSVLLGKDVIGPGARIGATPEDQRQEVMELIDFAELDPAARRSYVELVRASVPEGAREEVFAYAISELVLMGGYADVELLFSDIGATREERVVGARQAANSQIEELADERAVTMEDVRITSEWVEKQAPGSAGRVIGEALGEAVSDDGEFGFSNAADLVIKYQLTSGSDDVLEAFLNSFAAEANPEQALALLERIKDPERRERVRKTIR